MKIPKSFLGYKRDNGRTGTRNYVIIHYDSPDERGIDNALLYDRSRFTVLNTRAIPNTLDNKFT